MSALNQDVLGAVAAVPDNEENNDIQGTMKRFLSIAAIAVLSLAASAQSPQQPFKPWQFLQDKTTLGNPQCTLYAAVPLGQSAKEHLQSLSIDHFGNEEFLRASLYHKEFSFTTNRRIPVTIDFYDNQPLTLTGVVDGKFIDVRIPKDATGIFLSLVASSPAMHVTVNFDSDKEWRIPLQSVKGLMKVFTKCSLDASKEKNKADMINAAKTCEKVHFTGVAAAKITDLDAALQANDLEDFVARYPILCKANNLCKGVGWFNNQKGVNKSSTNDGMMWIEVPLDLTTGRRNIYLVTRNSNVTCDK